MFRLIQIKRSGPALRYAAVTRSELRVVTHFMDDLPPINAHRELICFANKRNFTQQPATNWHDGQIT